MSKLMKSLRKFFMVVSLIIAVCFASFAGYLYWEFNFGGCKDGCAEGMAFIFFLPALVIAGVSGVVAGGLYLAGRRKRSDHS